MVVNEVLRDIASDSYNRNYILSGIETYGTKNEPSLLKDKLKGYRNNICKRLNLPKEDYEDIDSRKFVIKCKKLADELLKSSINTTITFLTSYLQSSKSNVINFIKQNNLEVDKHINKILGMKIENIPYKYGDYTSIVREYVKFLENDAYLNNIQRFINYTVNKLNKELEVCLANSKITTSIQDILLKEVKDFNKVNYIDTTNINDPRRLPVHSNTKTLLPKELKVVGKNFIPKTHMISVLNTTNEYVSNSKSKYEALYNSLNGFTKSLTLLEKIGTKDRHLSNNNNSIYTIIPILLNSIDYIVETLIRKLSILDIVNPMFKMMLK
jgi:hypothetical protein